MARGMFAMLGTTEPHGDDLASNPRALPHRSQTEDDAPKSESIQCVGNAARIQPRQTRSEFSGHRRIKVIRRRPGRRVGDDHRSPPDYNLADGGKMKRSIDAILTTHTGSLPRPDDLVDLL